MKLLVLSLIILVSSCTKHRPAPVKDTRYKPATKHRKHLKQRKYIKKHNKKYVTVNKGDTLYSIGFSQNMDYKQLAKINGIPAPYRIYPGQKLKLKASKNTKRQSTVKVKPLITKKPLKHTNTAVKKPTTKPSASTPNRPVTTKPIPKPTIKPLKKPIVNPKPKPLAKAPSSNSKWIWPLRGKILSTYSTTDTSRKGIDISSKIGKPVFASNNGTVVYSGDGLLGYGELIIIKHENNLLSAYANNSSRLVKEGATVTQGQQIAKSGKGSDGSGLLHFEIRKNGQPVNPLKYLPKK